MLQSFISHILFFIFLQFLCLNHLNKIISKQGDLNLSQNHLNLSAYTHTQVNTLQQLLQTAADRVTFSFWH